MKLGLKLWSMNVDSYFSEAKRLYEENWFDYIELYIVPGTQNTLASWKKLNQESQIPFTLHAPHFLHGVNLADSSMEECNLEIFKQVEEFFSKLGAKYVVVHSGMGGNIDESVIQLKKVISLYPSLKGNILVENKPFVAPLDKSLRCRGAVIDEIKKVIDEVGCGFCLDVGHAICTSNSLKLSPYEFLEEFNKLNPTCYHLSDNFIDSEIDGHKHFGDGNYDFKNIFDIIDTGRNMAIETKKNSKESLDDFVEDVKWLKNLKE